MLVQIISPENRTSLREIYDLCEVKLVTAKYNVVLEKKELSLSNTHGRDLIIISSKDYPTSYIKDRKTLGNVIVYIEKEDKTNTILLEELKEKYAFFSSNKSTIKDIVLTILNKSTVKIKILKCELVKDKFYNNLIDEIFYAKKIKEERYICLSNPSRGFKDEIFSIDCKIYKNKDKFNNDYMDEYSQDTFVFPEGGNILLEGMKEERKISFPENYQGTKIPVKVNRNNSTSKIKSLNELLC